MLLVLFFVFEQGYIFFIICGCHSVCTKLNTIDILDMCFDEVTYNNPVKASDWLLKVGDNAPWPPAVRIFGHYVSHCLPWWCSVWSRDTWKLKLCEDNKAQAASNEKNHGSSFIIFRGLLTLLSSLICNNLYCISHLWQHSLFLWHILNKKQD